MKQDLAALKSDIIEAGKRAYERGYIAAYDGNISARINQTHVLITPAGISKGFMKARDLVVLDMNGAVVSGKKKPSSEYKVHLAVYKERPDVQSVCHLHPPYATAFAAAGIPFDRNVLTEAEMVLGEVALVEYGTPGTEELCSTLRPYLASSHAFLLANHGALTIGKDVFEAYNTMETLEHTAKILSIVKQLGSISALSAEQINKLQLLRQKGK